MLNEFKNFDANRLDLTQLVALSAYGRLLRAEYEELTLEEPDWVDIQLKTLRREIKTRNADRLESLLREKKARVDTLKTPQEKKTELRKEIADLEKQLASV